MSNIKAVNDWRMLVKRNHNFATRTRSRKTGRIRKLGESPLLPKSLYGRFEFGANDTSGVIASIPSTYDVITLAVLNTSVSSWTVSATSLSDLNSNQKILSDAIRNLKESYGQKVLLGLQCPAFPDSTPSPSREETEDAALNKRCREELLADFSATIVEVTNAIGFDGVDVAFDRCRVSNYSRLLECGGQALKFIREKLGPEKLIVWTALANVQSLNERLSGTGDSLISTYANRTVWRLDTRVKGNKWVVPSARWWEEGCTDAVLGVCVGQSCPQGMTPYVNETLEVTKAAANYKCGGIMITSSGTESTSDVEVISLVSGIGNVLRGQPVGAPYDSDGRYDNSSDAQRGEGDSIVPLYIAISIVSFLAVFVLIVVLRTQCQPKVTSKKENLLESTDVLAHDEESDLPTMISGSSTPRALTTGKRAGTYSSDTGYMTNSSEHYSLHSSSTGASIVDVLFDEIGVSLRSTKSQAEERKAPQRWLGTRRKTDNTELLPDRRRFNMTTATANNQPPRLNQKPSL